MKRIALAVVIALALTLACQQKAVAGGFGIQINIGGSCCNSGGCWSDCCYPGCYYFGYGYKWACNTSVPITWPCANYYYPPDCGYGMGYQYPYPSYWYGR
jgi:hypothetical protein